MSKRILITGGTSQIALELKKIIPKNNIILTPSKYELNLSDPKNIIKNRKLITTCDKIICLHSIISNKEHIKKTYEETINEININLISTINICELALRFNKKVRILLMGSESGIKGSHDIIYALCKTSLHKYVEERKILFKDQQLICIAPSTIIDAKMTLMRKDQKNLKKSINLNPKKRGLKSKEIANVIYDLMFNLTDYITNTVININGGKFSRM
jgi:short-subunit dehydrogenase involved in D-alanine esterification of teichoic acids